MCKAVQEIREAERVKGQEETLSVIQKLVADGRLDDVKRATGDPAFFEQVKKEYGLRVEQQA